MRERSLALGEGQNVGGPILAPVRAIQPLNRRVPGENDRELGVPHLECVEHRPGAAPQLQARHTFVRAVLHHEPHRHGRIV
jgi:hypothetical protein